ncbi:MAG: hypothetical protein M5U28_39445 [Sandaracinaceae bacterium]|nr:hypothetical protein [Sandaracinaceae bacterium]
MLLRARVLSLVLAVLALAPAAGRAQSEGDLRARVARLRAERPATVPDGTLVSIEYMLDISARIQTRFSNQAESWRRRAAQFLEAAEAGRDPSRRRAGRS